MKDYNVMIDGQKFANQPVKKKLRAYHYFNEHHKKIAIDLSK